MTVGHRATASAAPSASLPTLGAADRSTHRHQWPPQLSMRPRPVIVQRAGPVTPTAETAWWPFAEAMINRLGVVVSARRAVWTARGRRREPVQPTGQRGVEDAGGGSREDPTQTPGIGGPSALANRCGAEPHRGRGGRLHLSVTLISSSPCRMRWWCALDDHGDEVAVTAGPSLMSLTGNRDPSGGVHLVLRG